MIKELKKYFISSATVILFVVYVVYQRAYDATQRQNTAANLPNEKNNTSDGVVPTVDQAKTPAPSINSQVRKFINKFEDDDDDDDGRVVIPSQNTSTNQSAPTQPAAPLKTTGNYKDGAYNGSVVFARDADLQVQAIIKNGNLVDVKYPMLPNGSEYSTNISNMALPILRSEAIKMQSANVNVVSQATLTSAAFKESLAAALTLAKK